MLLGFIVGLSQFSLITNRLLRPQVWPCCRQAPAVLSKHASGWILAFGLQIDDIQFNSSDSAMSYLVCSGVSVIFQSAIYNRLGPIHSIVTPFRE